MLTRVRRKDVGLRLERMMVVGMWKVLMVVVIEGGRGGGGGGELFGFVVIDLILDDVRNVRACVMNAIVYGLHRAEIGRGSAG